MAAGNNVVGEVQVLVVPDGSRFGPGVQSILDKATAASVNAGKQMGNAFSDASKGADQLGNTINEQVGGGFARAAMQAAAFTGAIWAVKASVEGTVNKLAGLFDQLTQARAGFNAIIGQKPGDKLLADIQEFARVSPFVTQELVNYSQQLLGVGLASEKIVPLLKDTGNVIASVGGDTHNLSRVLFTLTQIQTVGRLTGQDAMQLQSSLIPITRMLGEYLGKTTQEVKKMQEQGSISAEQVMAAIQAAGQKVPHAMDNAVKTISGAKAVLSDTVTIMLQKAPALKAIYDDIVVGIQNFANKLSDPKVEGAISNALAGVGKVYESLKPAIKAFAEASGAAAMSGLSVFTVTLQALADVLMALQKTGALDLVAKALAAYLALKAPLALMQFATTFTKIAEGIGGTGGVGLVARLGLVTKATTASATATTAATEVDYVRIAAMKQLGMQAAVTGEELAALAQAEINSARASEAATAATAAKSSKLKSMVSMGGAALMMGGMALSSSDNQTAKSVGSVAQYAGMGAMVGGPWGAVAGGAVGAFMAIKNAAEDEKKKLNEALKQSGLDAGNAFVKGAIDAINSGGSFTDAMKTLTDQAKLLEDIVNGTNKNKLIDKYYQDNLELAKVATDGAITPEMAMDAARKKAEGVYKDQQTMYGPELKAIQDKIDTELGPTLTRLASVAAKLPEGVAVSTGLVERGPTRGYTTGAAEGAAITDPAKITKWAERYGMTLEQVTKLTEEDLLRIVTNWEQLDSVQKQAVKSATAYNSAFDAAKTEGDARLGGRAKEFGNRISTLEGEKKAVASIAKAYENKNDAVAQYTAEQDKLNYAVLAGANAAAETTQRMVNLNNTQGASYSDLEIKAAASAAQLAAESRAIAGVQTAAVGTISVLAAKYGYTKQQLWDILALQGKIDPTINIVVTADVDAAIQNLNALAAKMSKLNEALKTGDYSKVDMSGAPGGAAQHANQVAQAQAQKDVLAMNTTVPVQVYGGTTASSGGGGGGSTGPTLADLMKQAADAIKAAVTSSMDAAKQAADAWRAGIKEHVQYEKAISTTRAIANANKQTADIKYLDTGIETLKKRGLSEAALAALEVNGITDVRQVKKLLAADPATLKQLSTAVANRDKAAGDISFDREQEKTKKTITDAILAAAKILGYKLTDKQAAAISAQFTIVSSSDIDKVTAAILKKLTTKVKV
jgi:tape measure domain-containing protein